MLELSHITVTYLFMCCSGICSKINVFGMPTEIIILIRKQYPNLIVITLYVQLKIIDLAQKRGTQVPLALPLSYKPNRGYFLWKGL